MNALDHLAQHSPTAAAALRAAVSGLAEAGFDWCHPFAATTELSELYPFPRLGQEQPLGILVANDKRLWPEIERRLAQNPDAPHPIDTHMQESVQRCVEQLAQQGLACQVFWGFRTDYPGHNDKLTAVPLQRLAQAVGFASLGPAHLCAHPIIGPWFALRAVVIVGVETRQLSATDSVSAEVFGSGSAVEPCGSCSAPCRPAFEAAVAGAAQTAEPYKLWLAVRDACPIGREHRYSRDQILYHYSAAFRLHKKQL